MQLVPEHQVRSKSSKPVIDPEIIIQIKDRDHQVISNS